MRLSTRTYLSKLLAVTIVLCTGTPVSSATPEQLLEKTFSDLATFESLERDAAEVRFRWSAAITRSTSGLMESVPKDESQEAVVEKLTNDLDLITTIRLLSAKLNGSEGTTSPLLSMFRNLGEEEDIDLDPRVIYWVDPFITTHYGPQDTMGNLLRAEQARGVRGTFTLVRLIPPTQFASAIFNGRAEEQADFKRELTLRTFKGPGGDENIPWYSEVEVSGDQTVVRNRMEHPVVGSQVHEWTWTRIDEQDVLTKASYNTYFNDGRSHIVSLDLQYAPVAHPHGPVLFPSHALHVEQWQPEEAGDNHRIEVTLESVRFTGPKPTRDDILTRGREVALERAEHVYFDQALQHLEKVGESEAPAAE
ncbi:MAG: hypothetical protein SF028_11025 [Candidatus Sumerlaeia bacterium]|nr:hypothetical protein [Candidatus Sumerlaeia bacterium]